MTAPGRPARSTAALLALGLALVALVGGLLLGRGMAAEPSLAQDRVAVGFLRDMAVHHAQAVRMSEVVHRRSTDPELRYLAFDIMTTQQGQIGIMSGWLERDGLTPVATGPKMAWMGMPHEGAMPGMATDAELAALDELPVPEMEVSFLRLMTAHHVGGVDMAQHAADRAQDPQVANLARGMASGQASEIALMARMLDERGAAAPEAPAHGGSHGSPSPGGHAGH